MKFHTKYICPYGYSSSNTFTPITFNYTSNGQPTCCLIAQVSRTDGNLITTPVCITNWYLNINTNPYTITINFITGLTDNTQYDINFVVL